MGINFSYDLKEVIAVIKNLCDEKQIYSLGISSEQDERCEGIVEIYNKDRVSISYCIIGTDDDPFKVIYLEILGLYEGDFQAIRCVFDGKLLWDTLSYLRDRSSLIEEFDAQDFDHKLNAEFERIWNKEVLNPFSMKRHRVFYFLYWFVNAKDVAKKGSIFLI